jgi:hypothetical protein
MYEPDRKMLRHALAGRLLGAAARRLEGLSLAHIGASLDREVRDNAFPLLTDDRGLSFPITDRQALNHFLVYGPKSAARSRLLLDIAEARVRRGSGLLHVSTGNGSMEAEIEERARIWCDFGQITWASYSGEDSDVCRQVLDKVFHNRWIGFVRLPDPARNPEAATRAEARFCADLMRMSKRVGEEGILDHWRREYNGGRRVLSHAPTPIVFDDASRYVGRLSDLQAAMLKGLGFSIVHGLEDDVAFGAHDPKAAADVLANAMTKVVMGDELTVACGGTRMPRLGPDFFKRTAEVRDRQSRSRTPSLAMAH